MRRFLNRYSAFLSYKSEDVVFVRAVAERLLALGLRVWFAEYFILLKNYKRFQAEIDDALARSEFLVCFTNNRYASSRYCRHELESFSSRSDRVIEVRCPAEEEPHAAFPWLVGCFSIESVVVDEIVRLLARRLGVDTSNQGQQVPQGPAKMRVFQDGRETYALDVRGWEVDLRRVFSDSGGDIEGPKFQRTVDGSRFWGNLIVGDQVDHPRAWRASTGDDRHEYEYALDFAEHFYLGRWWWRLVERPVGLHLLALAGRTHVALTCKSVLGMWTRRYSIVFPSASGRSGLEFAFILFFRGPFESFARVAHLADALVLSLDLQWRR